MGGGSELIAESTNYRFYVSYSSSSGIQYRDFEVVRLKPEADQYGHRPSEWRIGLSGYGLNEDEIYKLYDAFKELENERVTRHGFDKLTQEQKTISDIWAALKESEHNVWVWQSRAKDAEKALNLLHDIWDEMEDRKEKERVESQSKGEK